MSGVGARGWLEPEGQVYQIAAPTTPEGTRVERLHFAEGAWIEKGEILAELDTLARREAALLEARAQVQLARHRLDLTRAGPKVEDVLAQEAAVAQARVNLENAQTNLSRLASLRNTRAIAEEEVDLRKSQVESAKQALRQAEATLAALKVVRPEDVAIAQAEIARAEATQARAAADLEACRIRSPITGQVLKIHARAGERVGDKGIAEIGNTSRMQAVAEVYEADVPRLRVGQPAIVRVQSMRNQMTGRVSQIGWIVGRRDVLDNDPVKDTDARVVEVRIDLDSPFSEQVAGLSYARVEVQIQAGE
jgi:HlyD family secretion protein